MKRVFLLLLLLTNVALGQSWTINNFGGTVAPGVHAALLPEDAFTYSENYMVHNGTRVTRYGCALALDTTFTDPFTSLHTFRSAIDSLALLMSNYGKWYYDYYGSYNYSTSDWRTRGFYYAPGYTTSDSFDVPIEIRPYTGDYTVAASTSNKFVGRSNPADVTMWMALVEPGDSIFVDTSNAQDSSDFTFVGIVDYVEADDRIMLTSACALTYSGLMRIRRGFDTASIPSVITVGEDAYVTNGTDPPHRIYDSLGTLYMQEADLAYSGQITDAVVFFRDSISGHQSYERYMADSVWSMRTRYVRIYDHNAAWATNEWAGGGEGLSTVYFCRLGWDITNGDSASLIARHAVGQIAPIIYNDANSLILLMPFSGDSTYEKQQGIYADFYPSIDTVSDGGSDTAGVNADVRSALKDERYYIFSGAGAFETVLSNDVTDSALQTRMGGGLFWVEGMNDTLLMDDSSYNDGTYYIHLLDRPQIRNIFRTYDSVEYDFITVDQGEYESVPDGWEYIRSYCASSGRSRSRTPSTPLETDYVEPRPYGQPSYRHLGSTCFDVYRYPRPPGDLLDWPNFEYWPIRYVQRYTGGSADTAVIVTAIPVDTAAGTSVVRVKDWEIVRVRLPHFAGLAKNNDNTVFGWGDPVSPALVSRSVNAALRGGEPMNWNAASDFVVTPTGEPIVWVVPFDNQAILFAENSIWGADFASNGFGITELSQNLGLAAPRSVVVWNKQVFFLSQDGYYRIVRRDYAGYEVTKVSMQLDEVFNTKKRFGHSGHGGTHRKIADDYKSLTHAVWSSADERIWLFFADDTASVPNYAATLDPVALTWDGFHDIGAAHATSLLLRDTIRVLGAHNRTGQLLWLNQGETDTGLAIRSILEGAIYRAGGDSVWIEPEVAWLTYSADNWLAGSADSLYFEIEAMPVAAAHRDSLTPVAINAQYIETTPFYFHDAGASPYWFWTMTFVSDTVVDRRWFQPIRMTVNFIPSTMRQ